MTAIRIKPRAEANMKTPSLPACLRLLAYSALVILPCVALAVLVVNLRATEDLRQQFSNLDTRITRLSAQTESDIESLSGELKDLSNGMQKENASTRRSTRGEVLRMGNELSERLDEMARRMKDIAAAPQPAGTVSTLSSENELARRETAARETPATASVPAAPATPSAPSTPPASATPPASSEQDLFATRRMKEGLALFESRKYGQAQKSFLEVISAQADNVNARLYYAASLYRVNPADAANYPLIEKNLRLVMSTDAENLLALETLAMVEVERRKWSGALENLKLLIALQPGNGAFLKTAGYCALKAADLQAARSYFESASRLSPGDGEALISLGDCESSLGNTPAAEQDWKAALSTLDLGTAAGARSSVELRIKLAKSAYARGSYEECLSLAKKGERHERSTLLRAYEGLSLIASGCKEEGRAILKELSSSSDARAAALAREGLQEGQQ